MTEIDLPDDRDKDHETGRKEKYRTASSGIINLGIDVGIRPLTDLLGGSIDVSRSPQADQSERQHVDENPANSGEPALSDRAESDSSVEVADSFLIGSNRIGEEFVVTAELPGVSEEDLSVGIDVRSDEFVIAVNGQTIDRISLPWASTEATKVWFNNGILEARLEPSKDGGSGG